MLGYVPALTPLESIETRVIYYDYSNAIADVMSAFIGVLLYTIGALICTSLLKIDRKKNVIAIFVTNVLVTYPFFALPIQLKEFSALVLFIIIPLIEGFIYNKVLVTPKKVGFKLAFLSLLFVLLIAEIFLYIQENFKLI